MLIYQLANSENGPYSISELHGMSLEELFEERDKIYYLDAMQMATKLDYQADADNNKPRRR